MITRNRVITFVLILCLISAVFLVACNSGELNEEETDYDFSVFFGSMDDAIEIDAMLTEYEKSSGVKIDPIIIDNEKDNKGTLESLLKDEDPPAAYAASSETDTEWLSTGGFIADFSKIDKGVEGDSFPYTLHGYGMAYDRAMFEEIFGGKTAEKLINSLKTASYEEWTVFVKALNDFIYDRNPKSFAIGDNNYKFSDKKGELTEKLNGVFAIPGADSNIYGDDLLDIVMQTVDLSTWIDAKDDLSGSAIQTLNPALTTYVNELDFITSYLSGEYSAGIRGSDFVNEEYYSNDKTNAMFMEGKSMFCIVDSNEYGAVEQLNAEKAERLEYLPIKMSYDDSLGGKTSDGAVLNNSIPACISYSFYVNNQCSAETQKKALDFLVWFQAQEEKWGNSLSESIKSYIEDGNILDESFEPEELKEWKTEIFGENGVRLYLRKELWTEDYKNEIKAYLTEMWCED